MITHPYSPNQTYAIQDTASTNLAEAIDDYSEWRNLPGWCQPYRATFRNRHLRSCGDQAADIARQLGYPGLWGWQKHVLDVGTELRDNGKWRWRRIAVIVPRQNGKTSLLSVLAALYLTKGLKVLYAAQSREQAYNPWVEAVDRIEWGMPGLITKVVRGNGREWASASTGGHLRLGTPKAKSIRGSVIDLVLLDEALELDPEFVATIRPTQTTRPMAQIWYLSSAGHANSTVLRRVRTQAIAARKPNTTALFEWAASPEAAVNHWKKEVWHSCIPTLGLEGGAEIEVIEDAYQDMTAEEFAREYLGRWSEQHDDQPINPSQWAKARGKGDNGKFDGAIALGIDVAVGQQSASIAAAGMSSNGRLRIELIDHRPGTTWLPKRIQELCKRHRPIAVIADEKSPAAVLFDDLVRYGWPLEKIDHNTQTRAASRIVGMLEAGNLEIGDAPPLDLAAQTALRRTIGAAWAFKRGLQEADVTPLVASVLALDKIARTENIPLIIMPRPPDQRDDMVA